MHLTMTTGSFLDTSLPDLIPPIPGGGVQAAHGTPAAPDPCAAVTRGAVEAVVQAIQAAHSEAQQNVKLNGAAVPTAAYPAAAGFAETGLASALDTMNSLYAFIDNNNLFEPPDDRVTNASAAFNVSGYARETIVQLHFARHWAAVSASHNPSLTKAKPAVECTERITGALELIEPLSADATRCYLHAFLP